MRVLSVLFNILYLWSNILDHMLFYIIMFYDIYKLGTAEWVLLTDDEDAYEDNVEDRVRFIFPKTDISHIDNSITMLDYLNNHMDEEFEVLMVDTTYAEIVDQEGNIYAVRASGNGDSFNHKVEFERL